MNLYISTLTLYFKRNLFLFIVLQTLVLILVGCKLISQNYSTEDQYGLARSRIESMMGQLDYKFALEKEAVQSGEAILFKAHFTNKTNAPVMIRIPQQTGVLDIDNPNTSLLYSITPLDQSISLETPLSILTSAPYTFLNPVQPGEFEILDPFSTKDIKLEIPNIVYLKQEGKWIESELPSGQYWIRISYENLIIGYEIIRSDQIYYVDKSAWVGRIDVEPILLTILP